MADITISDDSTWRPFASADRANRFRSAVYGWMCGGLALTAFVAWFVAGVASFLGTLPASSPLFWGVVIAQLAIVFVLSARVDQLSTRMAALLFVLYSALTGLTLSFVLLAFTGESMATTFVVSAGMFGAAAVYGAVRRQSLEGPGPFLFMGLTGVVLVSIVGLFWLSDALQFIIAVIGVIVFAGLAAYDANRVQRMADTAPPGHLGTYGVVGALAIYLDLINLFVSLLRFVGRRRD